MLDRLPRRIHWRLDLRTVLRAFARGALVLYAATALASLGRAYSVDGGIEDRKVELERAGQRLADAKARTEQLRSFNEAFEGDPEVRMGVIRRELHMLRPGERYVVFK